MWVHTPEKGHKRIWWRIVLGLICTQWLSVVLLSVKMLKIPIRGSSKSHLLNLKDPPKNCFLKKIHHQFINWSQTQRFHNREGRFTRKNKVFKEIIQWKREIKTWMRTKSGMNKDNKSRINDLKSRSNFTDKNALTSSGKTHS